MTFELAETVRVTRGDMRGRLGVVRRICRTRIRNRQSYGVEFPGEISLSTFRENNIEGAPNAPAVPEFLMMGSTVHRLAGHEPYQMLSGGWMGKRRRYWLTWDLGVPQVAAISGTGEACDFRRFPLERNGVVFAGLWSRYQPVELAVQQVVHLVDTMGRDSRA